MPASSPRPVLYAGRLTDAHVRATARLALRARGVRPDPAWLVASVHQERQLAERLVRDVVPERLPTLGTAVQEQRRQGRPAIAERLPGMLALGWRHVLLLRSVADPASDPVLIGLPEPVPIGLRDTVAIGLLGATFNAAVAVYDHLLDEPDPGRLRPVDAVGAVAALVTAVFSPDPRLPVAARYVAAAAESARRSAAGDRDWLLLVSLVESWAGLAAAAIVRAGELAVWEDLGRTVRGLLDAETALAQGRVPGGSEDRIRSRTARGPSRALGLMAGLDRPGAPPAARVRAADHLGLVQWLADDLADLAADARRGRPNAHLRRPANRMLSDAEVTRCLSAGATRLAAALASCPGRRHDNWADDLAGFALEVTSRWLQWDQHLPALTHRASPEEPVAAGVRILRRHQAEGYAGCAHRLTFPRQSRDGVRRETHVGLLFLRATVLEAFLDAAEAGHAVPDAVLAEEGLALLTAKHPVAAGGWSYLSTVEELPPDADDLAQVLRALHRLGGRTLAATCDEGVRLALDSMHADGALPTWVLPRLDLSEAAARMRECVELVGGGGCHLDVMANLLDALLRSDPDRYRIPVARGAAHLAAQQSADGSWSSAWYAGRLHATWLATSVLAAVGGYQDHVARARGFLTDTQADDGGWGEPDATALATAHALLALSELDEPDDAPVRDAGARRLTELQQPDGGWPGEPWIRFPTRDGVHTYGSVTATTAYAVKALLAVGSCRTGGVGVSPVTSDAALL